MVTRVSKKTGCDNTIKLLCRRRTDYFVYSTKHGLTDNKYCEIKTDANVFSTLLAERQALY